jgi:hypothetical protein
MKQLSRTIITLTAAVTLSLAGSAAAQHGVDDSTSSSSEVHNSSVTQVATETETTSTTSDDSGASNPTRQEAEQKVAELKANHKEQTADHRKNVCEAHKQGLTTKFTNIVNNSQKIQDRITGVLDKTVKYKTDNNLSPANFDSLLATAMTAQQTLADSITALKAVTPSLDCNNVSVATDVATFKTAAKTTRDNLKAYRTAVKAVVKSVLDTKKADEGSQQ